MKKAISSEKKCLEENPVMILNSIARLFDARARAVNPNGDLPHSLRLIMMILSKNEGISQLELAGMAHLKAPTVSLGLKKLEEMGLVERKNSQSDMRVMKVMLTQKGVEFEENNLKVLKSIDAEVMKGLSDEEIETLKTILLKMRQNFKYEEDEE